MQTKRKNRQIQLSFLVALALCVGIACDDAGSDPTETDNQGGQGAQQVKLAPGGATASNNGPGQSAPANVLDGDATTHWSADGPAPQWILLDLGGEFPISKVRLLVAQTPAGPTTHQIAGGTNPEQLALLGTLEGTTQDGQWLEFAAPATNLRYVRITTTQSPSWVAWREIEIYR